MGMESKAPTIKNSGKEEPYRIQALVAYYTRRALNDLNYQ